MDENLQCGGGSQLRELDRQDRPAGKRGGGPAAGHRKVPWRKHNDTGRNAAGAATRRAEEIHRRRAEGGPPNLDASGFDSGRLALAPDPFWSSPRFLSGAPPHLREHLASATILVLKGDANYRRVVDDAFWPAATPFAEACAGLPFPLVCLRTMKSDAVLGLPPGVAERLDASEPTWRIDGTRGVIQGYVPPRSPPGSGAAPVGP